MLVEYEFKFQKKSTEIFDSLIEQNEKPLEIDKDISMLYIGKKENEIISQIQNILKNNEASNNKILTLNIINEKKEDEEDVEEENNKNILFLIEYKNIYIGGVSLNLNMREGFGLNKYENSPSFYLGNWKNNMKEGTGFLKIDENTLYIGAFHLNQFEGFGILYYRSQDIFYFGEFENGAFSKGIYCNNNKELYYRGKFKENKKNDLFCTFLEKKNRHLYLGEVNNDIFSKGYLCLYQMNETKRQDENGYEEFVANFDIETFFYFDKKNEKNNISFINNYEFETEFRNKIQEYMKKIFEIDYRMSHKLNEIINYFNYLESLVNDEDYNSLERYKDKEEHSLEIFFMGNCKFYFNQFLEDQEEIDINEIQKEIEIPLINKEYENNNA